MQCPRYQHENPADSALCGECRARPSVASAGLSSWGPMRRRFVVSMVVTAFLLCSKLAGASHLAVTAIPSDTWTKEPGVRVDVGPIGSPDSHRASTPHVIRFPDGMLRMYYAGNAGILSAVSADGFTWNKESGFRIPVGIPGQLADAAHPFLFPIPGGFRMYYGCSDDVFIYNTCSAISADGLTWMIEAGLRLEHGPPGLLDSRHTSDPVVIEVPDGLRMYYHAFDGNNSRIMSAVSADGLNWVKEPGVRIDTGPPGSPDQLGASHFDIVEGPDGRLLMYYAGGQNEVFGDSILSAISIDGLTWTKESGIRVNLDPPGSFDDTRVLQPSILQLSDGEFRMYYTGFHGNLPRILSAITQVVAVHPVVAVNPDVGGDGAGSSAGDGGASAGDGGGGGGGRWGWGRWGLA